MAALLAMTTWKSSVTASLAASEAWQSAKRSRAQRGTTTEWFVVHGADNHRAVVVLQLCSIRREGAATHVWAAFTGFLLAEQGQGGFFDGLLHGRKQGSQGQGA